MFSERKIHLSTEFQQRTVSGLPGRGGGLPVSGGGGGLPASGVPSTEEGKRVDSVGVLGDGPGSELCKRVDSTQVHCVDLGESFPTSIY